jgi:hypothetical protein
MEGETEIVLETEDAPVVEIDSEVIPEGSRFRPSHFRSAMAY